MFNPVVRLKLPALDPKSVEEIRGSTYPEPFKSRMGDRVKRRLGDACGLTHFGVNLVTLGPGGQSALRHWHTHEEEFVFVLSGEVFLVTNGGEQLLTSGMCAGYPANRADAHHFINRSTRPAQYLEVGSRIAEDLAHYPDDDLMWVQPASQKQAARPRFATVAARKDGRLYEQFGD